MNRLRENKCIKVVFKIYEIICRLIYERDHIRSHINELITNFDAELRCLRHDKFKMDVDMKNADLKYVL